MTIRSCVLVLVLGFGAGCVELPLLQQQPQQKPPPPTPTVAKKPTTSTALVSPEEVTDTNAREQADALERELQRDSTGNAPAKAVEPMKKS